MATDKPTNIINKVATGLIKVGLAAALPSGAADFIQGALIEPSVDRIDAWLSSREGQEQLRQAFERADRWFAFRNRDPDLRGAMPLSLASLESVQDAVASLPNDFDEMNLIQAVHEGLSRAFPKLDRDRVTSAVSLYIDCLHRALLPLETFTTRLTYNTLIDVRGSIERLDTAQQERFDRVERMLKQMVNRQPDAAQAPRQIPAPVKDFVGREHEIAALLEAIWPSSETAGAMLAGAIAGLGGAGKSQLAFKVAELVGPLYHDGHVLLELRGSTTEAVTAAQALQSVIRALDPAVELPDDETELGKIYRSVLAGKRVLILADDADGVTQIEPLVPPPGCALLITSRQHFALPGIVLHPIGILAEREAVALLLSICSRTGSHARSLALLCGHLPLALRISATFLQVNRARSVANYLAKLESERLKILRDPARSAHDPQASVEASLRLSFAALSQPAQVAFTQLAVFVASFDREAALAVVEVDDDVEDLLDELLRRSLLEWDEQSERYALHDLVRVFAAAHLSDSTAVAMRYAYYYASVATRAGTFYRQGGQNMFRGLALFDRERAHIEQAWDWVGREPPSASTDELQLRLADATAYVGDLRFDSKQEYLPRLAASLEAAKGS